MALSGVVSEMFSVEKYRDLEIPVNGQSRSLKVVPFDRLDMASYYCSTVTLSLRRMKYWNIRLQKCRDVENLVRVPPRSL